MRNEPLAPELENIANELNAYHRSRLHQWQDGRDQRSRAENRTGVVRLSRAIRDMMQPGGLQDGPEAEFFREVARLRGQSFDPQRIIVPWEFFRRDLNAAQATAGGYLVGATVGAPQELLRPWSVVVAGGITIEESLVGQVTIPKTTGGATIYWQANETAQATASTPTFTQAALTPKIAIAVVNASRQFMVQADPERLLRREMLRAAGVAVDTAVLNGSGASGQPLGIIGTSGLSTQSGTSLAWGGVLAMKEKAGVANVPDGSTSFISTPGVRRLLEAREKVAGNAGFVWQDDRIAGCNAYATTVMPAGTMLSGPLSGITVGFWDLRIEINPFDPSMFKTGAVQIRVLVAVDLAITTDLTAFTLATSIT